MSATETMNMQETTPIIPKTCKAGVVVNAGPDFAQTGEELQELIVKLFEASLRILLLQQTPPIMRPILHLDLFS